MTTYKITYETTECGRCGGSGRYSYNTLHGDMCYGCNGKGKQLSKAGFAAQTALRAWKNETTAMAAGDVTVGMRIRMGDEHRPRTVTAITAPTISRVLADGSTDSHERIGLDRNGWHSSPKRTETVHRALTDAEWQEMLEMARNTPGAIVIIEETQEAAR